MDTFIKMIHLQLIYIVFLVTLKYLTSYVKRILLFF